MKDKSGRLGARSTSAVNLLLGVWLLLAPFILGYADIPVARWNDLILGLAIGAVAIARLIAPLRLQSLGWINFGLGLWLLLAPLVLDYGAGAFVPTEGETVAEPAQTANLRWGAPAWNDLIVGLLVMASAGLGVFSSRRKTARPAATFD